MPKSEPVFFLSHFRIKEGRRDVVAQIATESIARLEADKPRTVLFLSYLDPDRDVISFLHAFPDVESMDLHFYGADERARAVMEHVEPLGWELYGNASAAALDTLRQAAASAGVSLAVHPKYMGGFLRLAAAGEKRVD